jgi:hypothetical protein
MKFSNLAAAAAIILLSAGVAAAQEGQGPRNPAMAAARQACAADAEKFCPGKAGPDRRHCMADHAADLSDGCKSAIAGMRRQMQDQKPAQ